MTEKLSKVNYINYCFQNIGNRTIQDWTPWDKGHKQYKICSHPNLLPGTVYKGREYEQTPCWVEEKEIAGQEAEAAGKNVGLNSQQRV